MELWRQAYLLNPLTNVDESKYWELRLCCVYVLLTIIHFKGHFTHSSN